MDIESGSGTPAFQIKAYKTTLCLAYRSFGVVFGNLCTSPIYVYTSTFSGRMQLHEEDGEILGVLSLVFWTLILIPLCKYIIFVLGADDNGEGGTLALYSLLCRHTKVGVLGAYALDDDISSQNTGLSRTDTRASSYLKDFFDKHRSSRTVLLLFALLGTSMVITDGILTPSISVLSAVNGIKIKAQGMHENHTVVIACVILVVLFALQNIGTHRVGFLFAPVLLAWLLCISGVGIYNIIHWNPRIVCALSPYYVYNYFRKAGKDGWSSIGGIVLCITGAEAMFADLGHFSPLSIRLAFTTVVCPCLILAYMGEAAYLSKHKEDLERSFYQAIPDVAFWPVFIIATLATVVGSQAIISATFSIISQCRALKCFPRVKIIHTSNQIYGQIYIPEVNWILMVSCLAVVIGYRDIHMIGNAYGLAVITVMFVTTCLMFLVIVMVWRRNVLLAIAFVAVFGSIELLYFSACLIRVHKGGCTPLIFALITLSVMYIWHYGTENKHSYELQNKVSLDTLLSLGANFGIHRVPGICLIYSNVVSGVPPMFAHFVTNFPAFHRVLVFVTLQSLTVPKVPTNQQFLISRISQPEFNLFRCIVRYGYKDARKDTDAFENHLFKTITEFLQHEIAMKAIGDPGRQLDPSFGHDFQPENEIGTRTDCRKVRFRGTEGTNELEELAEARECGMSYMMGNTCIVASETSSYLKKFVINIVYGSLRRNCRRPATALGVPHTSLIEVGMVYRV